MTVEIPSPPVNTGASHSILAEGVLSVVDWRRLRGGDGTSIIIQKKKNVINYLLRWNIRNYCGERVFF